MMLETLTRNTKQCGTSSHDIREQGEPPRKKRTFFTLQRLDQTPQMFPIHLSATGTPGRVIPFRMSIVPLVPMTFFLLV